ncbi:MAG: ribonuclease G [Gammaproteobacteria bacterium]|jgi:ribonuclease G|nr:ribonuclease G [Gammaproteobacteria bacterium]|tara:strand:- start:408 stop:1886 length:1479 start_codon:yes stop_codon:yes gene_type:complete
MAEEIIINVSQHESRVAVVEQGLLQEIFIERFHTRGTVGNIYHGKVARILPGMQSAFVAIGHAKAAFMHITDLMDSHKVMAKGRGSNTYPPIQEVIHEGQELLVQVTKEPIGTKGARITRNISLASRYLVYLPDTNHVGISQRIEDEMERERLKELLERIQGEDGFIVRTASEGVSEEEINKDARLLRTRWASIVEDGRTSKASSMVYEDLPMPLRAMRDIINQNTQRIMVDSADTYSVLQCFLKDFIPDKESCLELVANDVALFDDHNLEDQISLALDRKVPLISGGYLVIDQTEAMSTIDVNTGAFVGRKDLEDTIYRTNLEAAAAIPRQLRLRSIGGIVILDFIDMASEEHKRQVLRTLEKGQQLDRVKWRITQISELGLVEMTRKRTHESLLKMMCEPCEICSGRGVIKSAESVCLEIFREIQRNASDFRHNSCLIMASQSIVDRLLDEDATCVSELSSALEAQIRFQVEASYSQEQFDVVLTSNGKK